MSRNTRWSLSQSCVSQDLTPRVGCYVVGDGWGGENMGYILEPCDDWHMADFRFTHDSGLCEPALNVVITGHVAYRNSCPGPVGWWVRVRLTFPGDGEPDSETGGWMLVYNDV